MFNPFKGLGDIAKFNGFNEEELEQLRNVVILNGTALPGVQNITSRNIHAVLADFIDHLAPVGATIENSIARKALIATITEVFENLQGTKKFV